jgi:hypothetical protein
MSGYSDGPVPGPPDVVIHFAGKCPLHLLDVDKRAALIFIVQHQVGTLKMGY